MQNAKPYILFCAGEDSGDCIGKTLIEALRRLTSTFYCVGAGGSRMQGAGLRELVEYEDLPVSGFGDVVPRYFRLRNGYSALSTALENPLCKGLVAIDYPGFNMKLVKLSGMLCKPSLYVAPPQVWAWKKGRASTLSRNAMAKLGVLFPFEKEPYEKAGCKVVLMQHPFVQQSCENPRNEKDGVLLLPGSREGQMLRNIPVFLSVSKRLPGKRFVLVVARESLKARAQKKVSQFFNGQIPESYEVVCAPEDAENRSAFYRDFQAALTAPGTATLELALSGVPFVVSTRPDFLTYSLGRLFVKIRSFALPSIILGRNVCKEFIHFRWNELQLQKVAQALQDSVEIPVDKSRSLENDLRRVLSGGSSPDELMSEFLAQLV